MLAQRFANIISPLLSSNHGDLSCQAAMDLPPIKRVNDLPFALQDGARYTSSPDWSLPSSLPKDNFKLFRQHWMKELMAKGWRKRVLAHFQLA